MNDSYHCPPALAIAAAVRAREASAAELVARQLERIERLDPALGAFCELHTDEALAQAQRVDERCLAGARLPLAGVPVAVKDNIETEAGRTTFGSWAFPDHRPGFDAAVVRRLREAGCVVLGKTNVPEFALAGTTDNERYGFTRNPWDIERTPGGSSGGSAVAVAAGMCPLAVGNDAGGSIRIPAGHCSVLGLKPSRGRVSWAPLVQELSLGIATNGPLAFYADDLAAMFDVIAGLELGDPYAAPPLPMTASEAVRREPGRLRVAVTVAGYEAPVDRDVADRVLRVADLLANLGHRVDEATPALGGLRESFLTLVACDFAAAELSAEQLEAAEPFARALRAHGARIAAVDYVRAFTRLRQRAAAIIRFWAGYDVLLTPTVSVLPPPLARAQQTVERLAEHWNWGQFTYPFNVTGQPALSVPAGLSRTGLPIGAQLVAAPGREDLLFRLAKTCEDALPWSRPTIAGAVA